VNLKRIVLFSLSIFTLFTFSCGHIKKAIKSDLLDNITYTTSISGTITVKNASDNSNVILQIARQEARIITNATVTDNFNYSQIATTNASGNYFVSLDSNSSIFSNSVNSSPYLPGWYSLKYSKNSYDDVIINNIPLAVNDRDENIFLDIELSETIPYFIILTPTSNEWIDTKIDVPPFWEPSDLFIENNARFYSYDNNGATYNRNINGYNKDGVRYGALVGKVNDSEFELFNYFYNNPCNANNSQTGRLYVRILPLLVIPGYTKYEMHGEIKLHIPLE
jgi:hypothetical protein